MHSSGQVGDPAVRFGGESNNARVDPTMQTDDLGSDPIETTTCGLKNIRHVAAILMPPPTK